MMASSNSEVLPQVATMGEVLVGLGAAVAAGGLIWFIAAPRSPRVTTFTSSGGQSVPENDGGRGRHRRSRAQAFLGDEATARPSDPLMPVAPPPSPLRWSFAF